MPSDFKPEPRYRNQAAWNRIVKATLMRWRECECGCGRPAASGHHFVPRGNGDDIEANCLVLAGSGTTLCHGAIEGNFVFTEDSSIEPAYVKGLLRVRIETVRLDVKRYALSRMGQEWLDRKYPLPGGEACT